MTRRSLLSMLAAAAADPERLLWTPGRKLISIPKPRVPREQFLSVQMELDQHEGPFSTGIEEAYIAPALAMLERECEKYIVKGAAVLMKPTSIHAVRRKLRNGVPARVILAYDIVRPDPRFICRADCMFQGLDR